MLIQMPADLQFHFGNLRIGLPLRVPDPIFRCLDDIAVNLRQCSKTASMARMRPSVSSFVMRFNLQIPEIRKAISAKENCLRSGRKFTTRYGVDKFIGRLLGLLAELGPPIR